MQRAWLLLFLAGGSTLSAEAAPFAYVTNRNDSTVSVIDTASNAVVGTVAVGGAPTGVAITPF
jgi:YVTN family beta-propeller protein